VRAKLLLLAVLSLLLVFLFCTEKNPPQGSQFNFAEGNSCIDCHTSDALLKKVATPLPPSSGEAGEG